MKEFEDRDSRAISRRSLIVGGLTGLISLGLVGKFGYDNGKQDLREQILSQYSPTSTALISGRPEDPNFYHVKASSSVIDINPFVIKYELKIDPRSKPFQILGPGMFPADENYGVVWEAFSAAWRTIHSSENLAEYLNRVGHSELSAEHPNFQVQLSSRFIGLSFKEELQLFRGKEPISARSIATYMPA